MRKIAAAAFSPSTSSSSSAETKAGTGFAPQHTCNNRKNYSFPRLKIYNIKLSICYKKFVDEEGLQLQQLPDPGVYKIDNYCCTIYKACRRRLINVTGLRHLQQIDQVKRKVEARFNLTVCHVKVDNMLLARKCYANFNIARLISTCEKLFKPTHHIIYDILLFRGVYILPKEKHNPSLIVFRTGSFTCMVKRIRDINTVQNYLDQIYTVENLR